MEQESKSVWEKYEKKDLDKLEKICQKYLKFLTDCKTERECTKEVVRQAKEAGYRDLEEVIKKEESLKEGDKVYSVCMNKAVALFCIGKSRLRQV